MKKIVIVCGPTASGKTDFAHRLAKNSKGEIVNADSMQIYKQIPIITASPSKKLQQEIPYHLFNFQNVNEEFSSAQYVQKASQTIKNIEKKGSLPIVVGGSGMYINMLLHGYSDIPDIDKNIRQEARNLYKKIGSEEFFQKLEKIDKDITKILNPSDSQRVIRAYEVIKQTGKSILFFQSQENIKPLKDFEFEIIFLLPSRDLLYSICNSRFEYMFNNGAIDEVKAMLENCGEISTSASKALGISQIISYLKSKIDKKFAIEDAQTKTRQYAKRQITWFSNQIQDKTTLNFSTIEEYEKIINSQTKNK